MRAAFLEVTNFPRIGQEHAITQHPRERLFAASLQFDEGLRRVVQTERRRVSKVGRTPLIASGNRPRVAQRLLAIHLDVESDDREGLREVVDRRCGGCQGDDREENPEGGSLHAPDSTALKSTRQLFINTRGAPPPRALRRHYPQIRRGDRRREAGVDAQDHAAGVADDVELAVGVDAERADVAERARAAELGRVLA